MWNGAGAELQSKNVRTAEERELVQCDAHYALRTRAAECLDTIAALEDYFRSRCSDASRQRVALLVALRPGLTVPPDLALEWLRLLLGWAETLLGRPASVPRGLSRALAEPRRRLEELKHLDACTARGKARPHQILWAGNLRAWLDREADALRRALTSSWRTVATCARF